jgi:hypothetical protein
MARDIDDIKGLRALYESKKGVLALDEAEAQLTGNPDKLTKFQLIDKLLIMTKFSEKFLKKMDEESLRMIFKTFMTMGKAKILKDLSTDAVTEGEEAAEIEEEQE